jgi:hypothetical protein
VIEAIRRAAYRVGQLLAGIRAIARPVAPDDLPQGLDPGIEICFRRMSRLDQHHCLRVRAALAERGVEDSPLLQAALIHDAGKGESGAALVRRSIAVLLDAWAPDLLEQIAAEASAWRRPFRVYLHHAEIGAEMAREAGAGSLVVDLIRWHHTPDPSALGAELSWRVELLKRVDDAN